MKKTLIITLLVAFGSFLITGAGFAAAKSGKTAVKKELKKTSAAKSTTQSKAKSSSSAQNARTTVKSKEKKKPAKQTTTDTTPAPVRQNDIYQNSTNPEVGLSGVQAGEQINWQAITSGGGLSSSLNFGLLSAIGQTAAGPSSSTNFNLNSGFVQSFGGSCCTQAGDANNDTKTNIADVTFLIARIFAGGAAPVCCEQADANADAKVNIADVTFLIARIFAGGAPPVCGPAGITC